MPAKLDEQRNATPATDRITVALTNRVSLDLDDLRGRTELSKTDAVNRAISLYRLVAEQLDAGRKLAFVDPETMDLQMVELL